MSEEVNGNMSDNGESRKPFRKRNESKKPYKKGEVKESLDSVIIKRNKLLVQFFRLIDIPVRLVGNANRPAIIYNEEAVINAYVHNFELRFTDAPESSNIVYTVKLNENPRFDKNKILQCLSEYKSRAIYKIYLKTTPKLYLSGYNYLNKEEKLGRYPVFSAYNANIHFTEDGVKIKVEELNNDGYQSAYE